MFVIHNLEWNLRHDIVVGDHSVACWDDTVDVVGEGLVSDAGATVVVQFGDFVELGLHLQGADHCDCASEAGARDYDRGAWVFEEEAQYVGLDLGGDGFIG